MKPSVPRSLAPRVSDTPRLLPGRAETYSGVLGLLDEVSDFIVIINLVGETIFANRAFRSTVGFTSEEFADLTGFDFVPRDQRDETKALMASVVASQQPGEVKLTLQCKTGRTFNVEGFVTPRRDGDTVTGTQWLLRPLTAGKKNLSAMQRESEQQAAENRTREAQLKELRANFISMASHELRTPLATLSLGVDFLVKYWPRLGEPEINRSLSAVHSGVQQMRSVLDDILVVGRSEEGHLLCNPSPVELVAFCRRLAEETSARDLHRHRLTFHSDHSSHDAPVDLHLLRPVLSNLLSNACKFSPEASDVTFVFDASTDALRFTVTDAGMGIPADEQGNVFELFFRARNATRVPGSGLGLAVVRRCVEAHRGTVTFMSVPAGGTRFVVTIPL